MSSGQLAIARVSREQALSDSLARLEEISSNRDRLHPGSLGRFGGRESREVNQVEYFPLATREPGEKLANHAGGALAIHAAPGVGRVNVTERLCGGRERETAATHPRSVHLCRRSSRNPVQPRLERTVRAIGAKLAISPNEDFLGDVLRLVRIVREHQRPPEHRGLKAVSYTHLTLPTNREV